MARTLCHSIVATRPAGWMVRYLPDYKEFWELDPRIQWLDAIATHPSYCGFIVINPFIQNNLFFSFHRAFSHSKSKKAENIRCSHCHGSISIFLNKKQGNEYVLVPVRKANGFANFVKEKYKDFKKPGVTHAEVMRLISTQFATLSHEEKKKY